MDEVSAESRASYGHDELDDSSQLSYGKYPI
jgi:hypothetical protein